MSSTWDIAGTSSRASQLQTQISKEDLLKTLGNQLNMDFSQYERWTRKTKVTRPPPPPKDGGSRMLMVGRVKSADSCLHGKGQGHTTYREKKEAAKMLEINKERNERIKILELRIRTRKKTLDEYLKRSRELLEQNMKLKENIESDEYGTLNEVKGLLRRYEKYRGGITTLNSNFVKEYEAAMKDLEETRWQTNSQLQALEKKVFDLDESLKEKQEELHTLMSYKDKEYPVKAMRIATLQKEIQNLKIANQEDQEDLEHIVFTELEKYEKEQTRTANLITKSITEKAIARMHPSLKDMALQNLVMEKEIEVHKKEQEGLIRVNQALEAEVKKLLHDPKTNTRLQMFPEFFPSRQKCTPDMEVVLDIPTQEWLPI
ncbi:uncharacterized protein C20orf96-like [Crassostrea virginica]|uniref:Uncharacterized protein C20orf96-like n=1 Tax=Crassostrea virginica TaxID=6565 RepID=A0A8B8ENB1_CRAVI|nr:uncharacterized protein C20orf96-like [Crassostrea virginica]XP_022341585.1 uncharacterized protein C20orf96-like [Crassostrea virginica]